MINNGNESTFQSNGFDIQRVKVDMLQVKSAFGILLVTNDLFGLILMSKKIINNKVDPVLYQIIQDGKISELKQGIFEFLNHEAEDKADKVETSANSLLPCDEIIKKISLKDGIIYSASKDSILDGSAFNDMQNGLITLGERVKQSVCHYDLVDLEDLLFDLQEEIYILDRMLCFAYDDEPEYSTEQIDNYISYFSTAKYEVKNIAKCIRSVKLTLD